MNYIPIIHTINDENIFYVLKQFIKTWYEVNLIEPKEEINFSNRFNVTISKKINDTLIFFADLSNSFIYGNKQYMYNAFEYIFTDQKLFMSYDEKEEFLYLAKENNFTHFFYGIKKEDLKNENPNIYRFVQNTETKQMVPHKNLSLNNFIINHICQRCAKLKTKQYQIFLEKNNLQTKAKIAELSKVFDFKVSFDGTIILEKENSVAFIDENLGENYFIIGISKWTEKQKEITEQINEIFSWNGWSNNTNRFKL